jgi:peptide/nickel transport system substrate-binding protein
MSIAPATHAQDKEKIVVYGLPYQFSEYSQYVATSYASVQWLSAVQAGLLSRTTEKNRAFGLELASAMTISADGLTYTFTLKDGLKFADGSDLTAEDVKFTYEILLDENVNTVGQSFLATFMSADKITVSDTKTIAFELI